MDTINIIFSISGNLIAYALELVYFFSIRLFFDIGVNGQYAIIMSFLSLFSFLMSLGIETTYLKIVSETEDPIEIAKCNGTFIFYRFIQAFIFTGVISLIIFLIPIYNNFRIFYIFLLGNLCGYLSLYIFEFLLISRGQMFKKAIISISYPLMKLTLLIALRNFAQLDLWFLSNMYFYSNLIYLLISIIFSRKIKLKFPDTIYLKKFLNFGYPLFFSAFIAAFFRAFDVILINLWFPLNDVANYYTAKQIFLFFISVLSGISYYLLPIFSKNLEEGKNDQNLLIIDKFHRIASLVVSFVVFLILIYSTTVIVFILGEEYKLTGILLSIFSIDIIILSNDLTNRTQIRALGKIKFYVKIIIIQRLAFFLLMILFTSPVFLNFGPIGGAIAVVTIDIIAQIFVRPIYYKKFNLGFHWGVFKNVMVMVIILIFQLYVNSIFSSIIFIPFFIILDFILYFSLNYLIKGFTKEDIKYIRGIISLEKIKKAIIKEWK